MNRFALLLPGVLLTLAAAPVSGQPLPLGSTTIVNLDLDNHANWARIGADGNGAFRIVWHQSFVGDGGNVLSRRLQANGAFGMESTLNTYVTSFQMRPDVAMNGTSDWTAIWDSRDQHGEDTGWHLFARRTTSDGTLLSGELPVNDAEDAISFGTQAVDIDATDEMVVSWSTADDVVMFERSTPAGVGLGEFPVGVGWGRTAVAALGDNHAVVAWTDSDDWGDGVFLRCVYDFGVAGPAVPANTTIEGSQYYPAIAAAADGHFAVLWYSTSGDSYLRVRLFDQDCTALGDEIPVDDAATIPTSNARIGMSGDGAFVVVWDILVDANDILAREFTKSGVPVGSSFSVLGAAFGSPELPDVAVGPSTFAVVWNAPDFGLDGSDDVLVRRFARRVLFTDDFESGDEAAWAAVTP